jgi:hypothetical protein
VRLRCTGFDTFGVVAIIGKSHETLTFTNRFPVESVPVVEVTVGCESRLVASASAVS